MSEVKFLAILECGIDGSEASVECQTFDDALAACRKWVKGETVEGVGYAVRPYASICIEQVVGTKLHETFFNVDRDSGTLEFEE